MATFSSPADSVISSGGNIVGVDLVRQDVPSTNQGGNTIVYEGYTPEACTLSEITVFMKTLNTQGTYTATFTNVTTGNTVLGSANFNMQTLSANTWTTLTLTGTASDLTFAADDRFRVSFASNNTSFDGAGIYFTMRFTSNTSYTPRAMDLLFSTTLTSGANSISTGTLPTGYKAYQIYIRARTDQANSPGSLVRVFFNGDQTLTNYQIFRITAFSAQAPGSTSNDVAPFTFVPSAGGQNHFFCGSSMQVYAPESVTGYKSFTMAIGQHNSTQTAGNERTAQPLSGVWRDQSAITSLLFKCVSTDADGTLADMVAGSSVHVYGLK